MIDIKDVFGNILLSTPINIGSLHKKELMNEDYVLLKFSIKTPIHFELGSFAIINDIRYEVVSLSYPAYNTATGGYDYNLRLDAYYYKWKNKTLYYDRQNQKEVDWKLTRTPDAHLSIVCSNLFDLRYMNFIDPEEKGFRIDESVDMSSRLVTYSNGVNIIDALTLIAETWDCEWWVESNIIHLGRCEYNSEIDFEIGKTIKSLSRSDSKDDYYTRVVAFGSTRNIPTNYRENNLIIESVAQKRLMLPIDTPYIDADPSNIIIEQKVEGVVIFDDVYPRRIGSMSNVVAYEKKVNVEDEDGNITEEIEIVYRYKDIGLTFSSDYILGELRIVFASGAINGMDFEVIFNPEGKDESDPDAQLWEIIPNENYGSKLPASSLIPVNGDEFVLYGFDISLVADNYVPAAEQELKQRTEVYIEKVMQDPSVYDCQMNVVAMVENRIDLEVGHRVKLIHPAFFKDFRQSRIYGYEKHLDGSSIKYLVGDTAKYSRLASVENEIKEIVYQGNSYSGSGGGGAYVVGRYDSTALSDRNVMSSLRSRHEFISRLNPDTASSLIKFLSGIEVGEFSTGLLGSGGAFHVDKETGKSYLEVDQLFVRMKAYFEEIVIKRLSHVGGNRASTPASMKCSRVEEYADYYRCYFNTTDGDKNIYNEFVVGDQARMQTFNLKEGSSSQVSNRYYWRLVVGIGEDYIDLSKTDCDTGSDIPMPEDEIIQLGNRTDKERQNAIIESSYGYDAPSYKQYSGIDSYSLLGKEKTVLSPDGNKLTGQVTIEPGSIGASNLADLPDFIHDSIEVGSVNLILNSGFTGDYESLDLFGNSEMNEDVDLYNDHLKHWTGQASVTEDSRTESRYLCSVTEILSQTLRQKLIDGESYVLSFVLDGNTAIYIGTYSQYVNASFERVVLRFNAANASSIIFSGNFSIADIQLERGTIPTTWSPSPYDNDSSLVKYESLRYVSDAIKGMTQVLGGLILTSMIQLGKYKDGRLDKVNAGISGLYNDDNDVAFWAGGTLEQAIRAVMAFIDDPTRQLTDEQWKLLANVVITHGGRAILNDAIFRGTVYAQNGVFNGTVYAKDGEFSGKITASSGTIGGFDIFEDYLEAIGKINNVANIHLNGKDGSGWLAGKNIQWDKKGSVTINGITQTPFVISNSMGAVLKDRPNLLFNWSAENPPPIAYWNFYGDIEYDGCVVRAFNNGSAFYISPYSEELHISISVPTRFVGKRTGEFTFEKGEYIEMIAAKDPNNTDRVMWIVAAEER